MAASTRGRHRPEDLHSIGIRPTPELVNGRLVRRAPRGQAEDAFIASLVAMLIRHFGSCPAGIVNGPECGYQIFRDDPDRVRFPDASCTRRDRLPGGRAARGHSRVGPDLAVEVVFRRDPAERLLVKVGEYLDAGIPLVWVVITRSRDVLAFRADGTFQRLGIGATLDGGDALPGFRCPVADRFPED